MGLAVAAKTQYINTIKKLFPQGDYWAAQFADPGSDASLFVEAKADELIKFRERMSALLDEGQPKSTTELITDWERVYLNSLNSQLPLEQRRKLLSLTGRQVINLKSISDIANNYGLMLVDIVFPFKTSFFGFSKFGISLFSRPAFFSVFYIITAFQKDALITEAKECINRLLKYSAFGRSCFGTGQFLGRSFFNKNYASRVYIGMKALDDFEREVTDTLLSSNIPYFLYKL